MRTRKASPYPASAFMTQNLDMGGLLRSRADQTLICFVLTKMPGPVRAANLDMLVTDS
jgi:hypothetical protein